MDDSKELELSQFLEISQQMLELANNNDWDQLPDLEAQRKSIMDSFFNGQITQQDSAKVEQAITDVLAINEKIEQQAQQAKIKIAQQLQGLKKKQNVHSAYLQNK